MQRKLCKLKLCIEGPSLNCVMTGLSTVMLIIVLIMIYMARATWYSRCLCRQEAGSGSKGSQVWRNGGLFCAAGNSQAADL